MDQEPNPQEADEQESKEPTVKELITVCREVLSQEDCDELATMEFEDALNNAATMLEAEGIDWVSFLTEKGLLEGSE